MRTLSLLVAVTVLCGCGSLRAPADPASDAPESRAAAAEHIPTYRTYAEALAAWRGPGDVNAWIGAMFQYDFERAVALSESQRANRPAPPILEPAAFYARPVGVCVDVARFAVETLMRIAPELEPRYLMIEFYPASIRSQVLRRHWVVAYRRTDGIYVFADSKRPGVVSGPYETVGTFIAEYARFGGREIVAYRELEGFQRKIKASARRERGDP